MTEAELGVSPIELAQTQRLLLAKRLLRDTSLSLTEIAFASDRSYMLIGSRDGDNKPPAAIALSDANFGPYPMSNGLTRLGCRFLANPADVDAARAERGAMLDAERAEQLGLITFALDDIDWDDEVRVFLEERASF